MLLHSRHYSIYDAAALQLVHSADTDKTSQDCLVLSASAVWTQIQTRPDSFVLPRPSYDEFCLVSTHFSISKFSVILNVFETEQLQIGNCRIEARQNCLVLSQNVFTAPTRTRQDSFVLSVSAVWTSYYGLSFAQFRLSCSLQIQNCMVS